MKRILLTIFFAALAPLRAVTLQTMSENDFFDVEATKENANFAALNSGKLEWRGSITQTARDALSGKAAGDLIINTTTGSAEIYNGAAWLPLASLTDEASLYAALSDVSDFVQPAEIDTAAAINALTTDEDFLVDSDIGSTVQAFDADLSDLADGSLTGSKVGFADTDSNFTAANVQAALEELDDVNVSGPNAADGKVDWSQLVNMPAGFADGSDDGSGGGSGTLTTLQEQDVGVGDADIVTLDFLGADFDLSETPDTEINIALAAALTRDAEWDTAAEINAATTDEDFLVDSDIGSTVQAFDADLSDLADGTLTGSKVGFADTDSNFTAANVQAALEELDDVNVSGPNAADGKVDWSQLVNVPAGFADGTDATGSLPSMTDLAAGTSLTLNTYYFDDFGANRTLTFSGTPANGDEIRLQANVTVSSIDLTVPTSYRIGTTGTTTSITLPQGSQELGWVYADGKYWLADSGSGQIALSDVTFDVGSVDTTEFGHLNGVTSALQTQLDAKQGTLTNEAGLYAALSDVSDFVQPAEIDTAAEINALTTDEDFLVDSDIGSTVQAFDADLSDLADGSLTGSKVGFADTDSNFTAADVQAAIEELDDANVSGPNAADYKVNWEQIGNMPSGFADGADATGGAGTLTTLQEQDVGVGDADIVTLDFLGADFDLSETPDTEINIALASALTRDAEWDTAAEINAATTDEDFLVDSDIGSTVQAFDADLSDLADGTLTGSKVGFADTDSNFTAADVQAALEELDDVNVSGPNAADGKVDWSQLVNVPAGFADGTDATGAGGSAIALDLADDDSNESADLTEIAVTGDTNSIFTEPAPDKLLIAVGSNWPTADTANAGDSATAFFSSGAIEHERGGLEADLSAYTGLVGINAGATSEVDTEAELETHLGSLNVIVSTEIDTAAEINALTTDADFLTAAKVYSETFAILEPDAVRGVSDDVVLRKFIAEEFPSGVTITSIHIDASAAYTGETFLFEHWDDASGTTQTTVESIACSAISTEDDGTLADATIPADYYLVANLDDTPEDVAYVSITISYTID